MGRRVGGSVSIADKSQTYFSKHVSWTSDLCSQQTSRSVSPHGCRIRIPNLTLPKPNYFSSLYTLLKQIALLHFPHLRKWPFQPTVACLILDSFSYLVPLFSIPISNLSANTESIHFFSFCSFHFGPRDPCLLLGYWRSSPTSLLTAPHYFLLSRLSSVREKKIRSYLFLA